MDQSSQYKKQKFSDQGDGAKSLIIASKLIESGDSAHLREMLTNGELSDINMSDGSGKGLLILASEMGDLGCLRVLLDYLDSSIAELVDTTSQEQNQLLKSNMSYDEESKSGLVDKKRPVLVACYDPDQGENFPRYNVLRVNPRNLSVSCVYAHGVNVLVDLCGYPDYMRVIKELLAAGVDVDAEDDKGESALVRACLTGDADLVKLLLDNGADANIRYQSGLYFVKDSFTSKYCGGYPLHIVCPIDPPLMRLLLENGAEANAVDKEGYTPLMRAFLNDEECDSGTIKTAINVLLEYGADPTIKDEEGKTVFDYVEAGSELEALLFEHFPNYKPVLK